MVVYVGKIAIPNEIINKPGPLDDEERAIMKTHTVEGQRMLERMGVKDPVVHQDGGRWHAWVCCHPLDLAGEEDRMTTALATSHDGLEWEWHGVVLEPRPGTWDARGTRVTAVLPDGSVFYDGRATKEENFRERTGVVGGEGPVADRRARAPRRRVAPVLRGAAARRQPRAAHGDDPGLDSRTCASHA